MNGRIYDPTLGRFLQADPFIQAPKFSQSFNRYSYVMNNPMTNTDPSGYISLSDINPVKIVGNVLRAVASVPILNAAVQAGIAYLCGPAAAGCLTAYNAASTYAVTGSLRSAVIAAAASAAGGGDFFSAALVGGLASRVQGGNFGHGFWAAGLGQLIGGQIKSGNRYLNVVLASVIGGTISKLTGGKFSNGAQTWAFSAAMAQDWRSSDSDTQAIKFDENGDPIPEGLYKDAVDTGLGLEMVNGKLTGEIVWGCAAADMSSCKAAIEGFDDLVAKNDFLDIENTLVVDTNAFEAHINFYNNSNSNIGGYWDGSRSVLMYNLKNGISPRVSMHEYGHSLGLNHSPNRTKNFMSYFNVSGVQSNVSYQLSGHQKYKLTQTYTKKPWYQRIF
jgi:hypothetical protein